ncbi:MULTISPECIES: DUF3343 domain-containing protein [Loigolactobacillus]|uniref:Putative Se/S carrier protein-like domain-containing protein n=1 Tax=Loigolactobacillus backii TaxID=375175 RepID=A0A192H135_9LACO|nr:MULTISPECIES: DUF3343 domain-containing protein [Loigolactobacillus]ANK61993.1 hypothetical protein AYR53_03940 [Loigolactobacillus backii]ANK65390.1 hypothetical protein AYR54_09175 [Loigolactobacillus backii]ANK68813.1 hypothetical protein AYR56_00785 [Loigolactobacillus backii]MDA5386811.1 DUF3343 domain-containing protein [Loigolactobacillus backii]MDA5389404.1 DUF3343 domain-containing protein [Loigolactobacillus backii]
MDKEFGLVVFDATHDAIKSEVLTKENNFKTRALTTPGQIVAGCGISLHYELPETQAIKQLLADKDIRYKAFYKGYRRGVKSSYEKLFDYAGK